MGEEDGGGRDLEDAVGLGETPVVVCGEDEVDEEYRDKGEDHAGYEDLDGEGSGELRTVAEDGVGVIGTGSEGVISDLSDML